MLSPCLLRKYHIHKLHTHTYIHHLAELDQQHRISKTYLSTNFSLNILQILTFPVQIQWFQIQINYFLFLRALAHTHIIYEYIQNLLNLDFKIIHIITKIEFSSLSKCFAKLNFTTHDLQIQNSVAIKSKPSRTVNLSLNQSLHKCYKLSGAENSNLFSSANREDSRNF